MANPRASDTDAFNACINASFKAGKINREVADTLLAADDKEAALNRVAADLGRQKREAAIQSVRLAQNIEAIRSHPGTDYEGFISLMVRDLKGRGQNINVDYLQQYYTGQFHSQFGEAMSRFRTRRLGFEQDAEGLEKFIRSVYGEAVDDEEIMLFAEDWNKLTEDIRKTFNAKGGSISKNEKWLLPQSHDAKLVQDSGEDGKAWKEFIRPLLDRHQMRDDVGNLLSDEEFEAGLDAVFETITTGGLNKQADFSVPRMGTKLSRKGSERRFLYFKDAESWIAYQNRFGKGDIFTALTDFIDTKAADIALMEIMGPNPQAMFDTLQGQLKREKAIKPKQIAFSNAVFNVVSGKVNSGELTTVSDFMQTVRNLINASTLGGAFLSAIGDIGLQTVTTKYNNIPTVRVLARQMSLLNPANEADRIAAVKMGLIGDAWVNHAHGGNRFSDTYGTGKTAKLSEAVFRGSLLSPWTDAGRKAFGMEFASKLADDFGKTFGELDFEMQRAFETYGITEADWNLFRKQKPLVHKGAKFADMTQPGGKRFHIMVLGETDFAVPTPDARVRAITTGGIGRGTVSGQAWRAVMMLKSFPITMASTHLYRAATQATASDKLAYVGLLAASTTIFGGLALQAKDVASGREPRPVDEKFFGSAFSQGGGLGIFGDFLFSDVNRFGGGITQTLFGPTGQLVDDTIRLTLGNFQEAVAREETNVLGESARFLKRYSPDIWQTRLFTDSLFDQVELLANPNAQRRYNSIVRKRQAEFNQGYWWGPGESVTEVLQ